MKRRNAIKTVVGGSLIGLGVKSVIDDPPNKGMPSTNYVLENEDIRVQHKFPNVGGDIPKVNDIEVDKSKYLKHSNRTELYHNQIVDSFNSDVVEKMNDSVIPEYPKYDVAAITRFVQRLEYSKDWKSTNGSHYTRHPVETLIDKIGDCKDKTALLYSILKNRGFDVGYVQFPNHIAPIIKREYVDHILEKYDNPIDTIDGDNYTLLEPTTEMYIGYNPEYSKEDVIATYTDKTGFNLRNPEAIADHIKGVFEIALESQK